MIESCGMIDDVNKLLAKKRRILRDAIVENIFDFLFLRRANSMLFE